MANQTNPTAVLLWRARLEQALKAGVEEDRRDKVLVVQAFNPALGALSQHDVTILTDLQRGKYALIPSERGLPRIQLVDVLQRGLQMLYPEVTNVRHYFWDYEPVRTPTFGQPIYGVQALTKAFIDHVQDGLAQYQVNIVHLGLLIVELARSATRQWGPKFNGVLLHEYQFGQFDMGMVINGELLYARYMEDISQLSTAMLEGEERFDLYYEGKKPPASLPIYLTGRGPLCREIVLRSDLQLQVNEEYALSWWPWPEQWPIENATSLPHSDEEGTVTEFRKEIEEHWSLLLARLAPPHQADAGGGQTLWQVIALLAFLAGAAAIGYSAYAAFLNPAPPELSGALPPANKAVVMRKSKALQDQIKKLQTEATRIGHSVSPAHLVLQALKGPLPGKYQLAGAAGLSARDDRVHLLFAGPHAKNAQAQLIAYLQKLKGADGKPLLRGVRPDPGGRGQFRGVQPGQKLAQVYLVGDLNR